MKLDLDCYRTQSTKKESWKVERAILSRNENLPRSETNAGWSTVSFPATPLKSAKGFFSVFMIITLRALSKGLNKIITGSI